MSIKISQLPSTTSSTGSDEFPTNQSGTTKKTTLNQMATYVLNAFGSLSLAGVAQTVKSAIDGLATALTTLSDFIGNTAMGTTATTVTGAIAEHGDNITELSAAIGNLSEWVSTDGDLESLDDFTDFIDGLYTTHNYGYHFGYITSSDALHIDLGGSGAYYYMALANTINYRIVIAISIAGGTLKTLYKASGTWNTSWRTLV